MRSRRRVGRRASGKAGADRRGVLGWTSLALTVMWLLSGLVLPSERALGALHNPIPLNQNEEPTYDFVDDDALFAYVTSDTAGGRVCIVEASVEDPANGDCDSPAWGTPNVVVGVGSVFTPIEAPTLNPGSWRLLTEDSAFDPTAVSEVFTVTPCDDCSRELALAAIQAWKDRAREMKVGLQLTCFVFAVRDVEGAVTGARGKIKKAMARADTYEAGDRGWKATIAAPIGGALGGALGFTFPTIDGAIGAGSEKALAILHDLSCAAGAMYHDIVEDPPDPDFATVAAPRFASILDTESDSLDELLHALDRQAAQAEAALTAFERLLGAEQAGSSAEPAAVAQAAAVAQLTFDQLDEMRDSAAALREHAVDLDRAGLLQGPVASPSDWTLIENTYARVVAQGFTADEISQLQAAGLTAAEMDDLRTHFHIPLDDVDPAVAFTTILRQLADTTEAQIEGFDAFAREAAAVSARRAASPPNQPPIALIETDSLTVPVGSVAFYSAGNDPDGSIDSYSWDFGNGETSDLSYGYPVYADPGTYAVTLTVIDNDGATATASVTLVVYAPPTASFTIAPSLDGEVPFSVTLDASASQDRNGQITAYAWELGDGTTAVGPIVHKTYAVEGHYSIRLVVTDDEGHVADLFQAIDARNPADNQRPVASFTHSVTTAGYPPVLDVDGTGSTDPDGTIAQYLWDFGDGHTGTGPRLSHLYESSSPSAYNVRLRVVDDRGAVSETVMLVQTTASHEQHITSEGPLTDIGTNLALSCYVTYAGDSAPQFFAGWACGTFLSVGVGEGSTTYGGRPPAGGNSTDVLWSPIKLSPATGSGSFQDPYRIEAEARAGDTGLRVQQRDSYVVGQENYRTDLTVVNDSDQVQEVILYRAADCYLQDSDAGYGSYSEAAGAVACRATSGRIEQWYPLTAGSRYMEDGYNTVWASIGAGQDFPNTILEDQFLDNGAGLSWRLQVQPGSTATVSHLTVFSPLGIQPLIATATVAPSVVESGGSVTYEIAIDNPNATELTLDGLSVVLPPSVTPVAGTSVGLSTSPPVVADGVATWAGPILAAPGRSVLTFDALVLAPAGTYTIDVRGASQAATVIAAEQVAPITVTSTVPPNSAPTVEVGPDREAVEGGAIGLSGTVGDPDGDELILSWSSVPGSDVDAGARCGFTSTSTPTTTISCDDDGTFLVTLTVDDGTSDPVADSFQLHVTNASPDVEILGPADANPARATKAAAARQAVLGAEVEVRAAISDPGAHDTLGCAMAWGDGTTSNGTIAGGICSVRHTFTAASSPTATLTVTDDDGGRTSVELLFVVEPADPGTTTTTPTTTTSLPTTTTSPPTTTTSLPTTTTSLPTTTTSLPTTTTTTAVPTTTTALTTTTTVRTNSGPTTTVTKSAPPAGTSPPRPVPPTSSVTATTSTVPVVADPPNPPSFDKGLARTGTEPVQSALTAILLVALGSGLVAYCRTMSDRASRWRRRRWVR